MAHGGEVITVDADTAINHVTPVFPSSEPERFHCKVYYLLPKK